MAIEERGKDRRSPVLSRRNEEAQAPGDDFGDKAERLQVRHRAVAIAGEFDAVRVHHQRTAELEIASKIQGGAALEDGAPGFLRRKRGAVGGAEGLMESGKRFR